MPSSNNVDGCITMKGKNDICFNKQCHGFVILSKVHHRRYFWQWSSLSTVVFYLCCNFIAQLNFSIVLTTLVEGTFTDRNFHCLRVSKSFYKSQCPQNFSKLVIWGVSIRKDLKYMFIASSIILITLAHKKRNCRCQTTKV